MLYEVCRKAHRTIVDGQEVIIPVGGTFVPTDAELAAFGDKLRPATAAAPSGAVEVPPSSPASPGGDAGGEAEEDEPPKPPRHIGGGMYELADGTRIKGKAEAYAAAGLQVPEE